MPVAVGYDGRGRFLELVGAVRPFGTVAFHAMTPPTRQVGFKEPLGKVELIDSDAGNQVAQITSGP